MLTQEVVELLVQTARVVLSAQPDSTLTSSQWMALRFIARANTFSRTLSGFAAYQATTLGTASQTIKSLETGGFLEREKSARDARSSVFRLTNRGLSVLNDDPMFVLVEAVDTLDERTKSQLRDSIRRVLANVTSGQNRMPVGCCRECLFFLTRRRRSACGAGSKIGFCKATGLPVEDTELDLLCVRFQQSVS